MRVVAGEARGRRLVAPKGTATRPTSDRVKEAMFSSIGDEVRDACVLDLWAGSGALGIEALSRGAATARFVDNRPEARGAILSNLRATGLSVGADIVVSDVHHHVRHAKARSTLVLCDPPYDTPLAQVLTVLQTLRDSGGLDAHALIVVERDRRDPDLAPDVALELPAFLVEERRRTYGDTVVLYFRNQEPES